MHAALLERDTEMSATAQLVDNWIDDAGESAMEQGHLPSWEAMIALIQEPDLSRAEVLDFGCNRGGMLRTLMKRKPFRRGLGVDIATEPLKIAQDIADRNHLPLTYAPIDVLRGMTESFDLALSHEVLYLLPDIQAHARQIAELLKPGGVYYAAIGEYEESPYWARWKKLLEDMSSVPPVGWSLKAICSAFHEAGLAVTVRPLGCEAFLPWEPGDIYFHSPAELSHFMREVLMVLRCEKPAAR